METQLIETVVLVVHVLAALSIIGLILLQQGRGADMGSGFGGGASNTVFGSGGSGNFLTRLTTTIAIAFFFTSFGLAYFAKEHAREARGVGIPTVVTEPAGTTEELPDVETSGAAREEIPAAAPIESEVPEG